jgi:hypothetical protein
MFECSFSFTKIVARIVAIYLCFDCGLLLRDKRDFAAKGALIKGVSRVG